MFRSLKRFFSCKISVKCSFFFIVCFWKDFVNYSGEFCIFTLSHIEGDKCITIILKKIAIISVRF